MFCRNCGAALQNGASFCSICGMQHGYTTNDQSNNEYQIQKNAVRQREMIFLDKAIKHFSLKRNDFADYDNACEGINYYSKKRGLGLFITGIVLFVLSVLASIFLYFMINVFKLAAEFSESQSVFAVGKASVWSWFTILLIFVIIPALIFTIIGACIKMSNTKKKNYFEDAYSDLSQELYAHYRSYLSCPVEAAHCNPQVLEKLMSIILSGKADTVSEALNIAFSYADPTLWDYMKKTQKNTCKINEELEIDVLFTPAKYFK